MLWIFIASVPLIELLQLPPLLFRQFAGPLIELLLSPLILLDLLLLPLLIEAELISHTALRRGSGSKGGEGKHEGEGFHSYLL